MNEMLKMVKITISHFHLGAHYTFKWFETDLTYDEDDKFVLRLRTEIPLTDTTLFFADYDTNHDARFKVLYSYSRDLAFGVNYHWRFHGGIGIEYAF